MNQLVIDIMRPTAEKITFEKTDKDKHSTGSLRSDLWGKLGKAGHDGMIQYSKEKFEQMLAEPNVTGINPDMKGNILATYATQATSIEPFIKLHGALSMQEEKKRVEGAMGSLQTAELIEKAIDYAFSDAIRKQDMPFVLICIACGSTLGRDKIWSTFVSKFDYFTKEFKSSFMIGRLVKTIVSLFTDNAKIDEIEDFFKKNPISNAVRAIDQGLEAARLNAALITRDGDEIKKFLSK